MERICFIITSVIKPSHKQLSYSNVRSLYSPEQRFIQTKVTISSIRKSIPGAYILLIEGGLKNPYLPEFVNLVDKYIYCGSNKLVRAAVDSKYKGLGEVVLLLFSRLYINRKFDLYFKISGRYYLNDNFRLSTWYFRDKIMGKVLYGGCELSTRLIGIPKKWLNRYFIILMISIFKLLKNGNLEGLLIKYIDKKNIANIEEIGISGHIAPNGTYIQE